MTGNDVISQPTSRTQRSNFDSLSQSSVIDLANMSRTSLSSVNSRRNQELSCSLLCDSDSGSDSDLSVISISTLPKHKISFKLLSEIIINRKSEVLHHVLSTRRLAQLQLVGPNQESILHIASQYGDSNIWRSLVRSRDVLLLARLLNHVNDDGLSPLMTSVLWDNTDAVDHLLSCGVDLEVTDGRGWTAVFCASASSLVSIVASLVRVGCDLRRRDLCGRTPLMVAVQYGRVETVEFLVSATRGGTYFVDCNNRSILHLAVLSRVPEMVGLVLTRLGDAKLANGLDVNGHSPLMLAAYLRLWAVIPILLESTWVDCSLARDLVHIPIVNNDYGLLELMLPYCRLLINVRNGAGESPLMAAIRLNRLSMVRLLLEYEPLLGVTDVYGHNALHLAILTQSAQMVRTLLSSPKISRVAFDSNADDLSPFDLAVVSPCSQNPPVLLPLLESYIVHPRPNRLFQAASSGNLTSLQLLLLSPTYFEAQPALKSPQEVAEAELTGALYSSDAYILLGKCPKVKFPTSNPNHSTLFSPPDEELSSSQNIFHAAAQGRSPACLEFIYQYCSHFAEGQLLGLDAQDAQGHTPLALAVLNKQRPMCQLLLQAGANICRQNQNGVSVLDLMRTHLEDYQTLVDHVLCSRERFYKESSVETNTSEACLILNDRVVPHPVLQEYADEIWTQVLATYMYRLSVTLGAAFCLSAYALLRSPGRHRIGWRLLVLWLNVLRFLHGVPVLWARPGFRAVALDLGTPLVALVALASESSPLPPIISTQLLGWAVLLSWLGVVRWSLGTGLSYQTAMYIGVLESSGRLLPTFFLVLLGFSFAYFLAYADYFRYNNPLHSFMTVSIGLLSGDVQVPSLTFAETSKTIHGPGSNPSTGYKIQLPPKEELLCVLLDGGLTLSFVLLVSIALLNMLVSLSIRGADSVEQYGKLVRLRNMMTLLRQWETVRGLRALALASRFRLEFLLGFWPGLGHRLRTPKTISRQRRRLHDHKHSSSYTPRPLLPLLHPSMQY